MLRVIALMLCSLCLLGPDAAAQSLYKCRIDGKLTYSGEPCKGIPSTAIEVPEAPPPRADAAEQLKREAAIADKLEKERLVREALDRRDRLPDTRRAEMRRVRCGKLRQLKKMAEENVEKGERSDTELFKKKAMHAADVVAAECDD